MQLRSYLLAALCALPGLGLAQQPYRPLDAAARGAVLDQLIGRMNAAYVFPTTAKHVEDELRARQRKGEFDRVTDGRAFADQLTTILRGLTHDAHLGVRYHAQVLPQRLPGTPDATPAERAAEQAEEAVHLRRHNYGIGRIDHLPGNIGYVKLNYFPPAYHMGSAYAAMMEMLAGSDALILDLRGNMGGDPESVALLESYFFDAATHMNDIEQRGKGTRQYWTQSQVAGPRYGGARPVYVLTSKGTFSGGEDLSYSMQAQRRATIVGEVTGGGANPGEGHRLGDHFDAFIPFGAARNPVTGTNWEGKGVQPDVASVAADAQRTAQRLALTRLLTSAKDQRVRTDLEQALAALDHPTTR